MAWVRPKHPKKKEPVSATDALLPLLSFISGRPTKPPTKRRQLIPREVAHDPILQSLHQAQAVHEERPTTSHSQKTPTRPSPRQQLHHREPVHVFVEEDHYERAVQRPKIQHERSPSPPPPPPPRVRPKPRVASYERPMPRPMARDRHTSRYRSSSSESEREPYWAVSSRFASRTSPFD